MIRFLFIIILIIFLTACGASVYKTGDDIESVEIGDEGDEVNKVNKVVNSVNNGALVFLLDVDGEVFEIEMPAQERYTAYDILSRYVEKEGIILKTKKYDFGMFIQGIGDKIGDVDSFWLFYVNGEMANSSVDTTVVKPGDVVRFEFTNNY